MSVPLCSHCLLPVRNYGQQREVGGETHTFCCYGCCLAFQVSHGEREEPEAAWLLIRLGVGAFLAMNIMLFSLLLYSGTLVPADDSLVQAIHVLLWILATPVLVILGGPFIHSAWQEARHGRITADTLVSIGALAAYSYSAFQVLIEAATVYFDTATMVLVLFTLGRYLEAVGRVRTARSLVPMLEAERALATVIRDGQDTEQPVTAVRPGAVVRVRPGARVPVDGVVVEGHSACNEAVLTGQSEDQWKQPGSIAHAGSVNGTGQLLIRATLAGDDTQWIRMSRQIREMLVHKSLMGQLVDRTAAVFVPAVIVLAVGTVYYWNNQGSFDQAWMAGLAVLVVACPCALGLAAPLATALGLGQTAQRGVLIRGGVVFERLAQIKAVAFDKTGTLTTGELEVMRVTTVDGEELDVLLLALPVPTEGLEVMELFREPFDLALPVEHPLARMEKVRDKDLVKQCVLALEEGQSLRDHLPGISGAIQCAQCDEVKATSLETLRRMVATGVGCALLPTLAATPGRPVHPCTGVRGSYARRSPCFASCTLKSKSLMQPPD